MRLLGLLICFMLLLSSAAYAADSKKVLLTDYQAKRLYKINLWLSENIDPSDCPKHDFFEVQKKINLRLLSDNYYLVGYEIVAECPDAPQTMVVLHFNNDQNYVE